MIPDMTLKPVLEQEHTHFAGKEHCRYIPTYLMYLLDMAAAYVYVRFPGLQDRRLWIGNGQSLQNECPGHDAHTGFAVDINYYTQNIELPEIPNATHYPAGGNLAQIWDGDVFLSEKFHFDANYMLFRILRELGITKYRTSELLRKEFAQRRYDITGMVADFNFNYNHHLHAHVEFTI